MTPQADMEAMRMWGGKKLIFHSGLPRPELEVLKAKKTNRKDLLSALFCCLRMVFVQTTKQICRDLLQHVQSHPVLRSSVEERWWKTSYIWSFMSPENFGLVGRSGDAGMGRGMGSYLCYTWIKETEKHWSGRKVNGWSDPACISPHPSHLTTLHLSRLTAGWLPGESCRTQGQPFQGQKCPQASRGHVSLQNVTSTYKKHNTQIFSLQPHLPVTCSCKRILCVLKNLWSLC